MAAGKKLMKIKFLSIARDLREKPYLTNRQLAEAHQVSAATITKVNQSRTWGNFLAHKKANRTLRETAVASDVRTQRAKRSGLNPVSRDERQLQRALEAQKDTMTRDEIKEEVRAVHDRIDVSSSLYRALRRDWLFRLLFGRALKRADVILAATTEWKGRK